MMMLVDKTERKFVKVHCRREFCYGLELTSVSRDIKLFIALVRMGEAKIKNPFLFTQNWVISYTCCEDSSF